MSAGPGGGGQRLAGPWGGRGAAAVVPGGSAPPAAPPVRAGMGRGQRGDPQHPGVPPLASRRCRLGLPGRTPPAPRGGFPGAGSGLAVPGCGRAGAFPGGRRCPGDSPAGPGRRRGGGAEAPPAGLAASAPCAGGGLAAAGGVAARSRTPRLRGLWAGGSGGCSWRGASRFWGPAGSFGGAERSGPCCGAVLQGLGSRSAERIGSAVI